MSLFDDVEKAHIEELLSCVHETFKREVVVFTKEAEALSLDNVNPLYNRYSGQSKVASNKVLTPNILNARIEYNKWNAQELLDDTGLTSSEGVIRLKIEEEDLVLIRRAVTVEVDDERYSPISDNHYVGPFEGRYYRVYLKRDA